MPALGPLYRHRNNTLRQTHTDAQTQTHRHTCLTSECTRQPNQLLLLKGVALLWAAPSLGCYCLGYCQVLVICCQVLVDLLLHRLSPHHQHQRWPALRAACCAWATRCWMYQRLWTKPSWISMRWVWRLPQLGQLPGRVLTPQLPSNSHPPSPTTD